MITFEEFINSDIPTIFKDLYLKEKEFSNKPVSIRLLEGIYNAEQTLIDNRAYNEVYDSMFISTADGDDLDKLGVELGFPRLPGETDNIYRARLIANYNIIQKGSTIEAIREFIESLGYTVNSWEKLYYNSFVLDETGIDESAYLNNDAGYGYDGWINYTIYFFLTPTPNQTTVTYLESLIDSMKKYYNKVYIR